MARNGYTNCGTAPAYTVRLFFVAILFMAIGAGKLYGLEPVINFRVACAGSQFFWVQGARSDGYRVSPSDE